MGITLIETRTWEKMNERFADFIDRLNKEMGTNGAEDLRRYTKMCTFLMCFRKSCVVQCRLKDEEQKAG